MTATLSPKQERSIAEATKRINLWDGAVRSGKTVSSLIAWLGFIANAGPGPLLMTGKTKDTIARNAFDPLEELLGEQYDDAISYTPGANVAWIFGRKVYVVGANDAKAQSKIRGMTLLGAYVDEITLLPEGFFKMLLSRLSLAGAKLFGTTNPDNPNHWLKKEYIDRADVLDLARWHFTLDDNPALDPSYVANLKLEYTGLWYRRFIQGEWVVAAGAIFDMWDPEQMVVETLPVDGEGRPTVYRFWVAMDYGTSNPFHALLFGLTPGGTVYVIDEWRWDSRSTNKQKTDAQYSAEVRAWLDKRGIVPDWQWVDPSAASFIRQLYDDGVPGVRAADNEVLDGIRVVSRGLASGRVKILSRCRHLLDEIPGYVWDEKAQARGEDKPHKQNDHGVDALRYGLMSTRQVWEYASAA